MTRAKELDDLLHEIQRAVAAARDVNLSSADRQQLAKALRPLWRQFDELMKEIEGFPD